MRIGNHETHEACDLFPLLTEAELKDLAEDIRANGLLVAITLFKGRILDGRNRYLACERVAVAPRFEDWEGDDPVAHVLSHNLHRRHLDASQRAMVAARAKTAFEEAARARMLGGRPTDPPANLQEGSHTGEAAEKAAQLLNVGTRSVYHAEKVLAHGASELVQAVDSGTIAVSAASEVAELPKAEQVALVEKGPEVVTERAKAIKRRRPPKPPKGFIAPATTSPPSPADAGRSFPSAEEIPSAHYHCLYMNPPWQYPEVPIGSSRPTISDSELRQLDLARICDKQGAHLWLWATWELVRSGRVQSVLEHWGFAWTSEVVWVKESPSPGCHWLRPMTEILILATRGSLGLRDEQAIGLLSNPADGTGKPPAARSLIASCTSGPRIELFAETKAAGWDAFVPASARSEATTT